MLYMYNMNNMTSSAVIEYVGGRIGESKFLLDFVDLNRLTTNGFTFNYVNDHDDDIYPSYINARMERVNLLQHLYFKTSLIKADDLICTFTNGNKFDLRRSNVAVCHKKQSFLAANYNILEYFPGHHLTKGQSAYVMKNPRWLVQEKESGLTKMMMYCEPDTLIQICQDAYERVLAFQKDHNDNQPITFYKHSNGYIACHFNNMYIHQIITGCYGNGKGTATVSVDHIDQNPLNNTLANLRVATQEEQRQNTTGMKDDDSKRKRQCIARPLPEGLTQDQLRKYVVYYKECYNKEKDLHREFFKVEGHPKLPGNKPWISSKSGKVTWQEKLANANKVVDDLAKNILPTATTDTALPAFFRIENKLGKDHLAFDKKDPADGFRYNMRMVLPENYVLEVELPKLQKKLLEKYKDAQNLF